MSRLGWWLNGALWWTVFVFLFPRRYVERSPYWAEFDFERWAGEEYRWREDRWNGYLDVAAPPGRTVVRDEGDCEDYALVAASWAASVGRSPVGLGFCFDGPIPRHAIAYDDERVYSSGENTRETTEEYLTRSEYDWMIKRRVF